MTPQGCKTHGEREGRREGEGAILTTGAASYHTVETFPIHDALREWRWGGVCTWGFPIKTAAEMEWLDAAK